MSMDFRSVVALLEQKGKVVHVKTEVNPVHELAGVAKKFEGKDQVVVFDRVKGQKYPVVCGLWWNRDIIGTLFGVSAGEVPGLFASAGKSFQEHPVPPVVVDNPPCQEEVTLTPDLYDLTIPTLALEDGGAYFSNCVVIAKDPDTGVRNTSIHRLMVTGKNRLGLLMDVGRHLRSYYERAEAKGEPLEITINNGVDPAVYVCATYPGTSISDDELGVAAICDGQIAGMAGASSDSPTMWQIGINVSLEKRRAGIGTMLVTLLKNEILKRGYLPYYGTAFSHIASQRVALASGFLPAWAELVTSSLQESIDTGKASNSPG